MIDLLKDTVAFASVSVFSVCVMIWGDAVLSLV